MAKKKSTNFSNIAGNKRTYILDRQLADTAFRREKTMVIVLTIRRTKPLYEIVRRKLLAAFHTAETIWMPDFVQQIVTIL